MEGIRGTLEEVARIPLILLVLPLCGLFAFYSSQALGPVRRVAFFEPGQIEPCEIYVVYTTPIVIALLEKQVNHPIFICCDRRIDCTTVMW